MEKFEIKGNWNIIKGKLKKEYANLTEDDLSYIKGAEEELIGRLQKRIGKTEGEIKKFIKELESQI